jgi:hypothetical protein
MPETELLADAELVGLCLNGDRDASGRIVERYQSLVCALAYSVCGDLARSEDLAQETSIAAWRQLSTPSNVGANSSRNAASPSARADSSSSPPTLSKPRRSDCQSPFPPLPLLPERPSPPLQLPPP